jgi:hypothetical protein
MMKAQRLNTGQERERRHRGEAREHTLDDVTKAIGTLITLA